MAASLDPKRFVFTVAGTPIVGFGKDDFFEADFKEDAVEVYVGAAGETATSDSNDFSGEMTIRIVETALSNLFLSELHARQRAGLLPIGFPVAAEDLSTGATWFCADAKIKKHAKAMRGTKVKEREWTFVCPTLVMTTPGAIFR